MITNCNQCEKKFVDTEESILCDSCEDEEQLAKSLMDGDEDDDLEDLTLPDDDEDSEEE
jgi:hypothetical protein